jgi:hypothetical protein
MSGKPKARAVGVRPAGEDHQVVSVVGGGGDYRRQPCGPQTPSEDRPGCPWRVDGTGFFPAEAFAHSAETAHDMSGHVFACHESGAERPATCAGFLLRGAEHNMAVRMKLSTGQIDLDQVSDGGHELHPGYVTMAVENGLSEDSPSLRGCRFSSYELEN